MIELRRRYSESKGSGSPSFSRLPAGYQEVEYLENTGGAYLVLSIKPQIGDAVKVKFRDALKNNNTSVCAIIDSERFGFGIDNSYKIYGNSAYQSTSHVYNGKINTVLYEWKESTFALTVLNDDLTKLGSFEYPRSSTYTEININLPIFTAYYSGYNSSFNMAGNVYIYEYYRDGELFANLVPCYRIFDHKPGMYDIVNDVFYVNQGAGEFSYGQDVHYNIPPEYQQVEYLESNKNQYIDTGVVFTSEHSLEITYQHEQDVSFSFGGRIDYKNGFMFANGGLNGNAYDALFFQNGNTYYVPNTAYPNDGKKKVAKILYDGIANTSNAYINDVFYAALNVTQVTNNITLKLFAKHDGSTNTIAGSECKVFYAIIKDKDNNYIRHLIPCFRKADNIAGMYDLVSGEFCTNAGTGEFILGPDII